MRTAKEIMEQAFKEALTIVSKNAPTKDFHLTDGGSLLIAASNLAIAVFSYEVEMEAMKDAHEQVDDDDQIDLGDGSNG